MNTCRMKYLFRIFLKTLFSLDGAKKWFPALMTPFGAALTINKIIELFFPQSLIQTFFHSITHDFWWAFIAAGGLWAIKECWPKLSVSAKLDDRDIAIELAIGDIFSFDGDVVIGSNTTFDTEVSARLISEDSLQGRFTKKYYSDTNVLDNEIERALTSISHENLPEPNRIGKKKRYPIGTAIRLSPKGRNGYFLAIANINEHGNASSSFELLKQALASLWVYIGERGSRDKPILIPVLGTGAGRLREPRQKIVQEIIKSFVAACSEQTFSNKLIIVLYEKDVLEHGIDFFELAKYLGHICRYTEFASNSGPALGTPVS